MPALAAVTADYSRFDAYQSPLRSILERSIGEAQRDLVERHNALVLAGIARAPAYERNWMLTSLFGQDGPALAPARIAETVAGWLRTGHFVPAPKARRQQTRDMHRVYETYTLATLLRDAWRKHAELQPILVEGSPDAPDARPMGNVSTMRRTHHFVLLRVGGRIYVIDGARGVVFDSLRTYLNAVMLPGRPGESNLRMKWFRISSGGDSGLVN